MYRFPATEVHWVRHTRTQHILPYLGKKWRRRRSSIDKGKSQKRAKVTCICNQHNRRQASVHSYRWKTGSFYLTGFLTFQEFTISKTYPLCSLFSFSPVLLPSHLYYFPLYIHFRISYHHLISLSSLINLFSCRPPDLLPLLFSSFLFISLSSHSIVFFSLLLLLFLRLLLLETCTWQSSNTTHVPQQEVWLVPRPLWCVLLVGIFSGTKQLVIPTPCQAYFLF